MNEAKQIIYKTVCFHCGEVPEVKRTPDNEEHLLFCANCNLIEPETTAVEDTEAMEEP